MRDTSTTRTAFINGVFTSTIPGEVAKRFSFADGEVGALYTLGRDPVSGELRSVVLYIATFPPSSQRGGYHDFGVDYTEQVVATATEARQLLAQFGPEEAALFRASCRPR